MSVTHTNLHILAHFALQGISFWTSGTDLGCKGKNHWCSIDRGIKNRNMSWSSQTDGDCISIQFSNQSQFSKSPCTNKLNYICEVIYFWVNDIWCNPNFRYIRGALTRKHFKMSAWRFGTSPLVRITIKIIFNAIHHPYLIFAVDMLTFDSAYNASTIPRKLKVIHPLTFHSYCFIFIFICSASLNALGNSQNSYLILK
jgi:hypothetical protein